MPHQPPAPAAAKAAPPMRVTTLDALRGFSLISMGLYHALFDIVYLFGHPIGWYQTMPGYLWQQSICWVFILVSGASLHYGKQTVRRGLEVLGCGLLITLVTSVVMPDQRVIFGILHFMGLAMLLAALLRRWLVKIPSGVGLALSFLLFCLFKTLPQGFIGFLDFPLVKLPEALYATPFLFAVGLPNATFFSGDYFPLLPWFFLFLSGYFLWALVKDKIKPKPQTANPLTFLGRHSLVVYLVHQPIIYGVLLILHQFHLL